MECHDFCVAVYTMEITEGHNKLTKEQLKQMIKDNTLPPHLREVFAEAKSWWFNNSTQVLKDNMRISNES